MILVRSARYILRFVALSTFLACNRSAQQLTEPVIALLPGVLELDGTRLPIETPATASVGVPIAITVYTVGGGCTRMGPTTSSVQGLIAVVEPFDSVVTQLPPNWGCPMDLRGLEHATTVQFDAAGAATIRFVGRTEPGDTALVIERSIVIQ